MKNIILITAASTLLLASGAWAGGTYPGINVDGDTCWVYDSRDVGSAVQVQGINYDIKAAFKVRGNDTARLVATCKGNDPALLAGPDFKKPFHFDFNDSYNPCEIHIDSRTVSADQWHQTLKSNGDFSLKCIEIFGPPE